MDEGLRYLIVVLVGRAAGRRIGYNILRSHWPIVLVATASWSKMVREVDPLEGLKVEGEREAVQMAGRWHAGGRCQRGWFLLYFLSVQCARNPHIYARPRNL